ncbi:hypothetical protein EI555_006762 [Monodon monoceros]|uniref:Uncharacterized protein n=1 Tax=Monodon monoceros TaxID=40151 RepID=A0A4U1FB73_MONMO|nr:hypothetical protein EI555_006762 [Monodon monoceros]
MHRPQAIMVGALPRTCFWESAARRPCAVSHVRLHVAPWPGRSLGTQPRRAQQPTCRRPGCSHSPTGRPPTPIRPLRPDWYLVHELGFLSPGPKTSIRTGGSGPVSGYGPIPSCKLPVDGQAHGGTIRSPRTSHQPAQGSDPYGLSTSQKDVAQGCGWDMGPGPCRWRWSPRLAATVTLPAPRAGQAKGRGPLLCTPTPTSPAPPTSRQTCAAQVASWGPFSLWWTPAGPSIAAPGPLHTVPRAHNDTAHAECPHQLRADSNPRSPVLCVPSAQEGRRPAGISGTLAPVLSGWAASGQSPSQCLQGSLLPGLSAPKSAPPSPSLER